MSWVFHSLRLRALNCLSDPGIRTFIEGATSGGAGLRPDAKRFSLLPFTLNMSTLPSILVFRGREEYSFENDVFCEELAKRFSLETFSVPSLYDLRSFGRTILRLRTMSGPLLVLSRFPERPMLSLMKKLEIWPERLEYISLDDEDTRESLFAKIEYSLEKFRPFDFNPGAAFTRLEEPSVKRWYPIIDEAACISCLECVNFCLFGVYTIGEEDRPLVDQPDACRDGCPACSRVCPAGAIMFPLYADPGISGRLSPEETVVQRETESAESLRKRHLNSNSGNESELDRLVDETDIES